MMVELLLIEDDIVDQKAFIRSFDMLGWHYVIASSLKEAFCHLDETSFDIIVADYLIGDGTALDIIERYSQPVIVITGVGDEMVAVNAMKAGAYDYLVKDVEYRYLRLLPTRLEHALQRRQLETQEREQRAFAEALYASAIVLTSTLDLDEVLKRILAQVTLIVTHDAVTLMLVEGDDAYVHSCTGRDNAADIALIEATTFCLSEVEHLQQLAETLEPVNIADTRRLPSWRPLKGASWEIRSSLLAALYVGDDLLGILGIDSRYPNHFTPSDAQHLQAFAHHAAIAVHNARLYQRSATLAAWEERQRLARDLHDSVTQTVFSANILAQSLVMLWKNDPHTIGRDLRQLTKLTQGALAEMRTLLLELRPQTLVEVDLTTLIRQLVDSIKGRTRAKVDFYAHGTDQVPIEVKTALYRVAQEALNNVVKHAKADRVYVELLRTAGRVELSVSDNGKGFDPQATAPGRLGLQIMRERATEAGVTLLIESQLEQGTRVKAIWMEP